MTGTGGFRDLRDVVAIARAHVGYRLGLLAGLVLLRGLVEIAGVASLYPLLALLTSPQSFLESPLGAFVYRWLGATSPGDAILRAGLVYASFAALGYAISGWVAYEQYRTIYALQVRTAEALFRSYLRRSYDFFLSRRGSVLAKNINVSTAEFAAGLMLHVLFMFSAAVLLAALFVFLVRVAPAATLAATVVIVVVFVPLMLVLRRPLRRWGVVRDKKMAEWFAAVDQALSGIKETKVHGMEEFFLGRFRALAAVYARMNLRFQASSTVLPNNAVQVLILLLLVAALVVFSARGADIVQSVPVIGVYYVAFSRMLPQANALFVYWTTVRYYWPSLHALRDELAAAAPAVEAPAADGAAPLELRRQLELADVAYRYPGAADDAIRGLSLSIPRGARIGFVGRSGAGKTTLIDLLLGLLHPSRGQVLVDGAPLTPACARAWQRRIGFVPQDNYLFDGTIAENVALGVEPGRIDRDRVRHALAKARLLGLVDALPKGLDTVLGDTGARLSGGETQRLGIARALYREPQVVILDEATSALDLATEREINTTIAELPRDITVLVISHRIHSLRTFDRLYLLEAGAVVAEGAYDVVIDEAVRRYGSAFAPVPAQ